MKVLRFSPSEHEKKVAIAAGRTDWTNALLKNGAVVFRDTFDVAYTCRVEISLMLVALGHPEAFLSASRTAEASHASSSCGSMLIADDSPTVPTELSMSSCI